MVTTLLVTAFTLGLLGSFHCVGMCGPLALSLPVQHLQGFHKLAGILVYNIGRVITYAILGAIFGLVGMSFHYFGWQQAFSIVLGSLLIVLFISLLFRKRIFKNSLIQRTWNRHLIQRITPLFHQNNFGALLLIGILNGLLPCGLVYMAIAGALATGNIQNSSLFMAMFGLGTLPAMMAMSFAGGLISLKMRNTIRRSYPFIIGLMGVLLILRGMNLNIPYISPAIHAHGTVENCH